MIDHGGFITDVTAECEQGLVSTLSAARADLHHCSSVLCAANKSSFSDTTDSGLNGEEMDNAFAFGHGE